MLRYRLWKRSGKLENDRREPRTSRGKIRKQRRLRGWPQGREDDLKPNTKFYTDLFPCSYQVWETLYRSQLKTRTATHTTNTYPQTFHDNQTLYNHTQPSITITQHTAITHPVTISLSHSHAVTHITAVTHTLTPTTVSRSNNSNHSPGAYSHPGHLSRLPLQTRWASSEAQPRQPLRGAAQRTQAPPPCPTAGTR